MKVGNSAWTMLELAVLARMVRTASLEEIVATLRKRDEQDVLQHINAYPGMQSDWRRNIAGISKKDFNKYTGMHSGKSAHHARRTWTSAELKVLHEMSSHATVEQMMEQLPEKSRSQITYLLRTRYLGSYRENPNNNLRTK